MNSDQINYVSTTNTTNMMPMAPMATMDTALPHTTAHSYTVHSREEKYLNKERKKEAKRAMRQEKMADKLSTKAEREFTKAATKAQHTGMFAERSAMRHEEKAVKLAAASNFHRQAASESHSEASRADVLSSLPPRGTLPVSAQSSVPLNGSGSIPLAGTSSYNPIV